MLTRGKLRWSSGYGLADVENHVPARANTVYHWASISHPVIAVAALQLAEDGPLDLDAPVQTYVSDFPVEPGPRTSRELLSTWDAADTLGVVVAAAAEEPLPDYLRALFRPAAMTSAASRSRGHHFARARLRPHPRRTTSKRDAA